MAVKARRNAGANREELKWPFGRMNYILFAVALAVIVIGYFALGQGSITLAPLLLVIGYCILIPVSLLVRDKGVKDQTEETEGVH